MLAAWAYYHKQMPTSPLTSARVGKMSRGFWILTRLGLVYLGLCSGHRGMLIWISFVELSFVICQHHRMRSLPATSSSVSPKWRGYLEVLDNWGMQISRWCLPRSFSLFRSSPRPQSPPPPPPPPLSWSFLDSLRRCYLWCYFCIYVGGKYEREITKSLSLRFPFFLLLLLLFLLSSAADSSATTANTVCDVMSSPCDTVGEQRAVITQKHEVKWELNDDEKTEVLIEFLTPLWTRLLIITFNGCDAELLSACFPN